jgi:rRNA-processing protein FCF1
MTAKTISKEELKSLYEKDFYRWIIENVELLKNKEFDLVDWDNVIEELESMGRSELRSVISFMAIILEHLYKWKNFRENENMGNSWIDSIDNARTELEYLFSNSPSLKRKAQEEVDLAWKNAVKRLVRWFEKPLNEKLAKKYFGKLPTEKDFPGRCPYTIEQILDYKPWLKDLEE